MTTHRFVVNDVELARIEADLSARSGPDRLGALVELAWHLRQRDGRHALTLVDEARGLLTTTVPPFPDSRRLALRMSLTEGEVRWLFGELDPSHRLAIAAIDEAHALVDPTLGADAQWLLASIAVDEGDVALRDTALSACERLAQLAGDRQRILVAQGAMARWAVLTDRELARDRWGNEFGSDAGAWPEGAATWIQDFFGNLAVSDGDTAAAMAHLLRQNQDAVATGQWQRAIVALNNIYVCFANLNDVETALIWAQRELDEARRLGWPDSMASALTMLGNCFLQLQRFDAACEVLLEARAMPGVSLHSRTHAVALMYLGEVYLRQGAWEAALEAFTTLGNLGAALRQPDLVITVEINRALAVAGLGRVDEALALVEAALVSSGKYRAVDEIAFLQELARLHSQRRDMGQADRGDNGAVLRCLQEAVELAASIEGYQVTAELYESLAAEHARLGDHGLAYNVSLEAAAAREKTVSAAAINRSVAMQITHQTERARVEAEHHRALAATLQQTTTTLETLGEIGREITRLLDEQAVFDVLAVYVDKLLDATHFSIYLIEDGRIDLTLAFGVERGSAMQQSGLRIPIDHPTSSVARCARTCEESVFNEDMSSPNRNHIGGTVLTRSAMFAPLTEGNRLLGVMTIQSSQAQAYGEREQLIFRTLCAYGAIGMHNAHAYRRLKAALAQLQGAQHDLARKNEMLEQAWREQQQASLTDPLTKLRNRRFLMDHIEDEVALTLRRHESRSKAKGSSADDVGLVFFMLDIDHFKSINDVHGHAGGDRVLEQFAQRLRDVARESDYLIRWGGEEFLVVARATIAQEGAMVAERFIQAVRARPFEIDKGFSLRVTCSMGFAAYPFYPDAPRMVTWSEVTQLADKALYMSKAAGRDCWTGLLVQGRAPARERFEQICQNPAEALAAGGQLSSVTSSCCVW